MSPRLLLIYKVRVVLQTLHQKCWRAVLVNVAHAPNADEYYLNLSGGEENAAVYNPCTTQTIVFASIGFSAKGTAHPPQFSWLLFCTHQTAPPSAYRHTNFSATDTLQSPLYRIVQIPFVRPRLERGCVLSTGALCRALYLLDDVYRQFHPQVGCAPSTRHRDEHTLLAACYTRAGMENRVSRWVGSVFTACVSAEKKLLPA